MKILLAYATYSSGTQTAAELVCQKLQEAGHTLTMKQANTVDPPELLQHDLVILASPSWLIENKDGQPHQYMGELINKSDTLDLTSKKFAIFGLGDTTYAHFCGGVGVMEQFVKTHHGELLVESLRIDSFYFEQKKNTQLLLEWVQKLLTTLAS